MRVCYFGKYDPAYARNSVIRKGLSLNGVDVVECRIDSGLLGAQYCGLLARMRSIKGPLNAILVAEHNQFVVPLAWTWARLRRVPLLFDPFTSMYETDVEDRQVVYAHSATARRRFWLDALSMRLADAVLADTGQHGQYFTSKFGVHTGKVHIVPVGADDDIYKPTPPRDQNGRFLVLFWGTYIPLHGIDTILNAAHRVREHGQIRMQLIGDGQMYPAMRRLAGELGLPGDTFDARVVPQTELMKAIARADLCLGIFGDSDKARRVVPNKVYQALAARKAVVTGDSPALREFFVPGQHLCAVSMADAEALADGILRLEADPALRHQLADQGYARFRAGLTPGAIGQRVRDVLERIT
jgi:glycosyltransferase involved in cell wall biosynthesis